VQLAVDGAYGVAAATRVRIAARVMTNATLGLRVWSSHISAASALGGQLPAEGAHGRLQLAVTGQASRAAPEAGEKRAR
jgi:hypothetical protein